MLICLTYFLLYLLSFSFDAAPPATDPPVCYYAYQVAICQEVCKLYAREKRRVYHRLPLNWKFFPEETSKKKWKVAPAADPKDLAH